MSTATLPLRPAPTEANWRLHGHCLHVELDVMHPDPRDRYGQESAKAVCHGCPVQQECLDDAIRVGDWDGVRAGLTGEERRQQHGGLSPRPCERCGATYKPRAHTQIRCTPCARLVNSPRGRGPRR